MSDSKENMVPHKRRRVNTLKEVVKFLQEIEPDFVLDYDGPEMEGIPQGEPVSTPGCQALVANRNLLELMSNGHDNMAEMLLTLLAHHTDRKEEAKGIASILQQQEERIAGLEEVLKIYESHMSRFISSMQNLSGSVDQVAIAIRDNASLQDAYEQLQKQIKEQEAAISEGAPGESESSVRDPLSLSLKLYGTGNVRFDGQEVIARLAGSSWSKGLSILVEHTNGLEAGDEVIFYSTDANYAVGVTAEPLGDAARKYYGNAYAWFRILSARHDKNNDGKPDDGVRPYAGRKKLANDHHIVDGPTWLKIKIEAGRVLYQYSADGEAYITYHEEARSSTAGPLYMWAASASDATIRITTT